MKIKSRGNGTRYDCDFGGNHLQRLRDIENRTYLHLFYNCKKRTCTCCHKKKETKGGTNKHHKFLCAECSVAI